MELQVDDMIHQFGAVSEQYAPSVTTTTVTVTDTPASYQVQVPKPCPSCGHCPTCGRGAASLSPSPWWPYQPSPWWQVPYYYPQITRAVGTY